MMLAVVRPGSFIVTWHIPQSIVKEDIPNRIMKKYSVINLEIAGINISPKQPEPTPYSSFTGSRSARDTAFGNRLTPTSLKDQLRKAELEIEGLKKEKEEYLKERERLKAVTKQVSGPESAQSCIQVEHNPEERIHQVIHTQLNEDVQGIIRGVVEEINGKLLTELNTVTTAYNDLSAKCKSLEKQLQQSYCSRVGGQCQQAAKDCNNIRHQLQYLLKSKVCQRPLCVQMNQRIATLEQELEKRLGELKKLFLMKHMAQQHDEPGIHEDLNKNFVELWSSTELILEELEKHFPYSFHAKVYLTEIFVDAYEKSKEHLHKILIQNMKELYKRQTGSSQKIDFEGMSRAHSLLLHSSGIKTHSVETEVVRMISDEVRTNLQKLPHFSEAKDTLKNANLAALDKVVKVAWNFVAQACPIVVCTPETMFDEDLHLQYGIRWNDENTSLPLIYARPLVYCSYHGDVMNKGLVGNMPARTAYK